MSEWLITESDLAPLLDERDAAARASVFAAVKERVYGYLADGMNVFPHRISTAFRRVCATSDIHSDFEKLVQIVHSLGVVELPAGVTYELPAHEGHIASAIAIVVGSLWVGKDTLFVVCGDLVDGVRGSARVKNDALGSFEFMIHCFLYNLRIRARLAGSDVLFTFGNHDLGSVFGLGMRKYVDAAALGFFGASDDNAVRMSDRSEALKPFYMCSPYVLINLLDDVVFVHGGVHATRGGEVVSLMASAESLQGYIDNGMADAAGARPETLDEVIELLAVHAVADAPKARFRRAVRDARAWPRDDDAAPHPPMSRKTAVGYAATWSRVYADAGADELCATTGDLPARGVRLVVVGHCATNTTGALRSAGKAQCHGKSGCVVVRRCAGKKELRDNGDAPTLAVAFVDTGLSAGMNAGSSLRRPTDVLVLTLIAGGSEPIGAFGSTGRYYYSRLRVGPLPATAVKLNGRRAGTFL
jgi:hypothetical protein